MPATSTSFRIDDRVRQRLADRAASEGISATALLERLIIEGTEALDHPGIVFRGPPHDRRAALAAGPDVWEVVSRVRELPGTEEERIAALAAESDLHPRQVRVAIDYAATRPDDINARIERNRRAAEASRQAAENREALLG